MNTQEIKNDLMNNNTGGYFYKDNCRINYSSIYGWYVKNFINGKMETINISEEKAEKLITESLA